MKKDIHGILNILMGVALLIVVGLYNNQIHLMALTVMSISGVCLIGRELWMHGEGVTWAVDSKKTDEKGQTSI